MVKERLSPIDPYFKKLADAMVTWTETWDELNSAASAPADNNEDAQPIRKRESWYSYYVEAFLGSSQGFHYSELHQYDK